MAQRWTRFADERVHSQLIRKAEQLGAAFSLDADGCLWFDDEEWCRLGDPHILTLDDEFGPQWVAVYADEPAQRAERIRHLTGQGIRHVVWFDESGTSLVLDKQGCPASWDYA